MRLRAGGRYLKRFRDEAEIVFDAPTVAELAGIIGLPGETATLIFREELVDLCAHYRAVIAVLPCDLPGAPFNMPLTKRVEWLEINVIKPAERLIGALADECLPMFCAWPYPLSIPEFRNNSVLKCELATLLQSSMALRDSLGAQQSEDAGHNQELRAEIFASIARLLRKHRPELSPSRGVYDPELRRRVGTYVDAASIIYSKITGLRDNLDRLIRGEIGFPS